MTPGEVQATATSQTQPLMALEVPVYGMTCSSCRATVSAALGAVEGVRRVEVDLDGDKVVVEGEAGTLDEARLRARIEALGYRANPEQDRPTRRPAWGALALGVAAAGVVVVVGTVVFRASDAYFEPGRLAELNATFSELSVAAVGLAFLFGLAVGFSPSSYAMAPAVVGYVTGTGAASGRRAAKLSAGFLARLVLTDVMVGAAFAAAGTAALRFFTARLALWYAAAVVALLMLAVINLRLWQPRLPQWVPRLRPGNSAGEASCSASPLF